MMLEEVTTMTERHADERQHVAGVIRGERLQRGWSVGEAAKQVDVYGSAWSRWESGVSMPKPAMLKRLGELFDLPDDWMVPAGTLSQPPATVDLAEQLARVEALQRQMLDEVRAERERIEALYQAMTKGGTPDGPDEPRHHDRRATDSDARRSRGHRDR